MTFEFIVNKSSARFWEGIRGGITKISYSDFLITDVNCTRGTITMITPFQAKIMIPTHLAVGSEFLIESQLHYPKPRFMHATCKNPLTNRLRASADKKVKRVGDGYMQPSETKSIS